MPLARAFFCVATLLASGPVWSQQQTIDEIVVTATRVETGPSAAAPDVEALIETPGDINDPIRALFNLPGLTFAGSDLDEPTIRGAAPGQNLYLVDGIPVPDLFHALSDSIISPDVVRTLSLESAAFGPAYGGAVGGVIDVGLRRPASEFAASLSASQLKAGVLIEGPITESVSGYFSFRNNLAHLFLEEFERGQGPLIYQMPESRDYVGRLSWLTDRFELSGTVLGSWDRTEDSPRDNLANIVLGEREVRTFDAQALRLQSLRGANLQTDIVLSHSIAETDRLERSGAFEVFSVEQWSLRSSLSGMRGAHTWTIGVNIEQSEADLALLGQTTFCDPYGVICGTALALSANDESPAFSGSFLTSEAFVSDAITLGDHWIAELGVHVSHDQFLSDTRVEPRVRVTRTISDDWSIYAAAGLYSARPELPVLTLLGEDQEYTASTQLLAGQRIDLPSGFRVQTEFWYKSFEGDVFINTAGPRTYDAEGYGLDVIIGRPWGERLTGWLAVSLSDGEVNSAPLPTDESVVQDPEFDFQNPYAFPYSATLALNYDFGGGYSAGMRYRVQSGVSFTPLTSVGIDTSTNRFQPVFGAIYSDRLSDYHRLDFRVQKLNEYSFGDVRYFIDVLNATDRNNAGSRDYVFVPSASESSGATAFADDESGIPFFIAFGVEVDF